MPPEVAMFSNSGLFFLRMSKDTFYFSHDYNARNDHKIKRLISKHGYLGYGIFWAIIEDLYNNANALRLDCESIAFDLRTTENVVQSIIHEFELFVIDGDKFGSLSIQRRIEERNQKSTKARESAYRRWNKDANALQTHSDGNAIKERKGKEIKVKEKKEDNNNAEVKKLRSPSSKKIFFKDSDIFEKIKFKDAFPEWSKEKLLYYWEAAKTWSGEGNKKVDWKAAIANWERKDKAEKSGFFKNNNEETATSRYGQQANFTGKW